MIMKDYTKADLLAIEEFLHSITEKNYLKKLDILSGSTIGQHVRHIVEFYIAVLESMEGGVVCYDNRKRNLQLETDLNYTIQTIQSISLNLEKATKDRSLILRTTYDGNSNYSVEVITSFYRELGYCIEHSIHHQALIKIGAISQRPELNLPENFGIAPATIKYRKEQVCAR